MSCGRRLRTRALVFDAKLGHIANRGLPSGHGESAVGCTHRRSPVVHGTTLRWHEATYWIALLLSDAKRRQRLDSGQRRLERRGRLEGRRDPHGRGAVVCMVRLHGLVSRQGGEEPPLFLAVQLAERPPPRPMEGPARHPDFELNSKLPRCLRNSKFSFEAGIAVRFTVHSPGKCPSRVFLGM